MISWCPRCYIPSFVEIGLPVLEKIFEGFLPYMGLAAIFVNMTSIMSSAFHFLVPESFHKNFVQIGTVVPEKIRFEFLYATTLDLDLQYSYTFINLIRCLLLLTFRSLAAIVSEKSTVFTFSFRKA